MISTLVMSGLPIEFLQDDSSAKGYHQVVNSRGHGFPIYKFNSGQLTYEETLRGDGIVGVCGSIILLISLPWHLNYHPS
jgi:hypothetical protein